MMVKIVSFNYFLFLQKLIYWIKILPNQLSTDLPIILCDNNNGRTFFGLWIFESFTGRGIVKKFPLLENKITTGIF